MPEHPSSSPVKLRISVDRGGTFTDLVARSDRGDLIVKKFLSIDAALSTNNQSLATDVAATDPILLSVAKIINELSERYEGAEIVIEEIRLGTTVATNALLERRGEPTLLITNKGFGDCLIIGYQNRPDIFALNIGRPRPLFEAVIELDCRYSAAGDELCPFDSDDALSKIAAIKKTTNIQSAAIIFMHGYKYTAHELACAGLLHRLGFKQISLSHQTSGLIRYVSRGDTTLLDAYLTPPLKRYIDGVAASLAKVPLLLMKSDGGLAKQERFSGKDAILSGPAGGVVGAVAVAQAHQVGQSTSAVIGFDMGGTSTDVSYYLDKIIKQMECTIAGVTLRTPMVAVHTVAAGGGSILSFDGSRFLVGPESAGALPGPACYGCGGPATVTDANLILGRLSPAQFPRIFGPLKNQPLNKEAAQVRLKIVARQIAERAEEKRTKIPQYQNLHLIAAGFLKVATEKMAQAIKKVSVQKGHDVRGATLVAFGGAGGQHACLIAESLQIERVLINPLAGVLSAYGIAATNMSEINQKNIRKPLDQSLLKIFASDFIKLFDQNCKSLAEADGQLINKRQIALAYKGSDTSLWIDYELQDGIESLREKFEVEHKKLFGFIFAVDAQIFCETISAETIFVKSSSVDMSAFQAKAYQHPEAAAAIVHNYAGHPWQIFCDGQMQEGRLFERERLSSGSIVTGPALITEKTATTVVEPGWQAQLLEDQCLLLTRKETVRKNELDKTDQEHTDISEADPVELELFNNIFMSIAEEMGLTLQKVSHSVNIKERLDFSCAIFDQQGRLIANAPHIPVHLGSMGDSVVSLIEARGNELKTGQAYVLNNPYNGGTHLPDLTVISPIFSATDELIFFVASRGHHADIGGITPGSMPASSKHIDEEGVLFDNLPIMSDSRFKQNELIAQLSGAKYPARNISQNIKDLQAQIAANNRGEAGLKNLIAARGLPTVRAYMAHVRANAATAIRILLKSLRSGEASCTLDDGSVVNVKITVDNKAATAVIDFSGTSAAAQNNLNAPLAVTRAAVLYVFRTLARTDMPLNDGCSEPLQLIVPAGCLLNPTYPSAVVAGNVETSQVIVDTLYQALGILAGSQGTMNNFTFGDSKHQYYETIAGGSGAGLGFAGTDAVQTHMTNSRLTDPEVLEERFPVLVEEFSIRRGSGGTGNFPGGCGARRKIRFLKPMTVSILANRRTTRAPGLNGGGEGESGANYLIRPLQTDAPKLLSSTVTLDVAAGEVIWIDTPGGGGAN